MSEQAAAKPAKPVTGYLVNLSVFMPFDPSNPQAVSDAANWAQHFNDNDEGRIVVEKFDAKIVTRRKDKVGS